MCKLLFWLWSFNHSELLLSHFKHYWQCLRETVIFDHNVSRKKYKKPWKATFTLRLRHNGHDGVSNHQPHHCLLNRSYGRISKETPKLRVTGHYVGNSPGTGEFPAQMASNAENMSIWWRHHDKNAKQKDHQQAHTDYKVKHVFFQSFLSIMIYIYFSVTYWGNSRCRTWNVGSFWVQKRVFVSARYVSVSDYLTGQVRSCGPNRPTSQIPQCACPIAHSIPHWNRNLYISVPMWCIVV